MNNWRAEGVARIYNFDEREENSILCSLYLVYYFRLSHTKSHKWQVEKTELISNDKQTMTFHNCIEKVEIREKDKDFQPNLTVESNPLERFKVLQQVKSIL